MSLKWINRFIYLLFILLVWLLIAVITFAQEVLVMQRNPDYFHFLLQGQLEYGLIDFVKWALLTPLVFLFAKEVRFEKGSILRGSLLVIVLGVAVFLLSVNINTFYYMFRSSRPFSFSDYLPTMEHVIPNAVTLNFFMFISTLAVGYLIQYSKRARSKEIQASNLEKTLLQARLQALKMKLNPHFLFNTLNTISSLAVRENTKGVRELVALIGVLLRDLLESDIQRFVNIREEIETLNTYIAIEKFRFGKRLNYSVTLDPEVSNKMVPPFILQPIVENSIKHGFSKSLSSTSIAVEIKKMNESLHLSVIDDGHGLPKNWSMETDKGLGLSSVQERLLLLFENRFSLTLRNREQGGVHCELEIPIITLEDTTDA